MAVFYATAETVNRDFTSKMIAVVITKIIAVIIPENKVNVIAGMIAVIIPKIIAKNIAQIIATIIGGIIAGVITKIQIKT